jgi:polysaccharide pyruvyl transferase WcaK-like protein
LDELTRCALAHDVPVVFFACGVGGNWSHVGRILVQRALKRSRLVFVRDRLSMKRLRALVGEGGVRTELTIDPALLAAQVFRQGARSAIVGLNVMSPDVVNRHAGQTMQWTALKDLWVGLAMLLARDDVPFEFFTNGSPEDAEFCREVVMEAERRAGCRVGAFVPTSADEFVARMSTYRSVVVHRLHAAIVAVAFKIPVVALSWDDKLQSFFDEIGLGSQVMPLQQATPQGLQTSICKNAATVSDAVLARANELQSAALQLATGRTSTAVQHGG